MRIALKVPLSPYLGYGSDGIGIASELIEYGADVHMVPGTLVDSPLPLDVALLFAKAKLENYDITLHHLDPDSFYNDEGWKTTSGLAVGWTMWEFSNLKNAAGYSSLRERMQDYDVFLAYDDVSAEAIREVFDGPVLVLQGGFEPKKYEYIERDWYDPKHFRFCMLGQLHDRKDPFVAIQAFNELKSEYPEEFDGAELHLKNSMAGALHSKMNDVYKERKIRIYNEIWDKDTLDRFYSQMHCLVAPSRGEGKNLPALEFQSTGGVVIATNWGGHTQWLNKEYSYPLNFSLTNVSAEFTETQNARADINHLKELMLHVYRNRDEAKRKGEIASEVIPQLASWESVIKRLFIRLAEVDPKVAELAARARSEAGHDD